MFDSATTSRLQIDRVGRIRQRPAREHAGVPIWRAAIPVVPANRASDGTLSVTNHARSARQPTGSGPHVTGDRHPSSVLPTRSRRDHITRHLALDRGAQSCRRLAGEHSAQRSLVPKQAGCLAALLPVGRQITAGESAARRCCHAGRAEGPTRIRAVLSGRSIYSVSVRCVVLRSSTQSGVASAAVNTPTTSTPLGAPWTSARTAVAKA
jgi:hypothetical protein